MSNEKKLTFDRKIIAEGEQILLDLLGKYPELKSVALVVTYDLPAAATATLPVGVFKTRDSVIFPSHLTEMQSQLARLMNHLSRVMEQIMADAARKFEKVTRSMEPPRLADAQMSLPPAPPPPNMAQLVEDTDRKFEKVTSLPPVPPAPNVDLSIVDTQPVEKTVTPATVSVAAAPVKPRLAQFVPPDPYQFI